MMSTRVRIAWPAKVGGKVGTVVFGALGLEVVAEGAVGALTGVSVGDAEA